MAQSNVIIGPDAAALPTIRKIGPKDLRDALSEGLADFAAMPTHIVFIGLFYPFVALFLGRLVYGYDVLPLLFPIAAGCALLGPFAAIGLYELSRRRERGLDTSWKHAFDVLHSPSFGAISALGLLLMAIFLVWVATAKAIYVAYFGYAPAASMPGFFHDVMATPQGWALIVVGNGIGFLFAVLVLTISVVSFPLLLDREVGAAVALLTSVKAVLANPLTMALWGVIVALALLIGALPAFFGLAIVVPVLGHATWHLYRRVVAT